MLSLLQIKMCHNWLAEISKRTREWTIFCSLIVTNSTAENENGTSQKYSFIIRKNFFSCFRLRGKLYYSILVDYFSLSDIRQWWFFFFFFFCYNLGQNLISVLPILRHTYHPKQYLSALRPCPGPILTGPGKSQVARQAEVVINMKLLSQQEPRPILSSNQGTHTILLLLFTNLLSHAKKNHLHGNGKSFIRSGMMW